MNIITTDIEGLIIIEPRIFTDDRGYFYESYSEERYRDICHTTFVQDNVSRSSYGVVRGLHFQRGEHAQAKLVGVLMGSVLDVAVDLRPGSPTYGRHYSIELTSDNHRQFFIPRGFAHGFSVLSPTVIFQYKCDNYYHKESEGGILWSDPTLAIDWRIPKEDIILSDKDKVHPLFG